MEKRTCILDRDSLVGTFPALRLRDPEHVPYAKRRGEAESVGVLEIKDYDGTGPNPEAWTEIGVTEHTTGPSGRVSSRTITFTLRGGERELLRRLLNGEGPTGDWERAK